MGSEWVVGGLWVGCGGGVGGLWENSGRAVGLCGMMCESSLFGENLDCA